MTQQTEEIDIESAKDELQTEYRNRTGKELPDHVAENYNDLVAGSPSPDDMRQAFEHGRKAERADSAEIYSRSQVVALGVVMAAVGAVCAAAIVGSIVATFGTVIATVVGIMFGFAVGVVVR